MSSSWAPKKPNFGKPPPGYIAGLGRGATGFITRSDVGPSKIPEVTNLQASEVDDANYNEAKFDQWEGFQGSLFAKGNLDDEDKQAEDAYDFCEKRIWQRRQKERELLQKKMKEQPQIDNSITTKFIDLKRDLATITNEEWEAIPECVDLSIKKRKRERFAPVPDGLVMNLLSSKEGINSVADDGENIEDFHDAKEVLLRSKLDSVDNSVTGKSNLDKVGYMTELNSHKLDSEFIGDVKKARTLLKSALSSNPKNPDIWLSAARV